MTTTSRFPFSAPFLLLFAIACSDAGGEASDTGGTASGGGSASTAGSSSMNSGAGNNTAGVPTVVHLGGSGQALGGGDQGSLFPPDSSVPIMKVVMGGTGGGGAGAPNTIPGDGHSASSTLGGSIQGKATFTQMGVDVMVVVNLTGGCNTGNHMFRIYDGDSCDDAKTEGMPWVPRGVGLGSDTGIACTNGKGSLNYTRKGDDKTKNLTVASHDYETDLTTHVVIVSDEKDPNSRASCGNFFY